MSQDIETHEKAILFGLVTAAFIARKIGWSLPLFARAVALAWRYRSIQETR